MTSASGEHGNSDSYTVLGTRVNAVQIPDVISTIEAWIREGKGARYIAVTGMHGIMEAERSAYMAQVLSQADLVVPDGFPLVLIGRRRGFARLRRRVYGPELFQTFLERTAGKYRHFLYGGPEGVAQELAGELSRRYGAAVVGAYSPPFRPLNEDERRAVAQMINDARADVVWVGLSTPKQEMWMYENRGLLSSPVLIGVGAAFDFCLGRIPSAPAWMKEHGLEWLFRLLAEPRRLWRRYLLLGSRFVYLIVKEELRRGRGGR